MSFDELIKSGQELSLIEFDDGEANITYRLGREQKYLWSHPEEKVRAEIILSLVFDYRYSPDRIDTEVSIPNRSPTNWADVVVFQDDRRRDPYIAVEVAAPTVTASERVQKFEQVFGYANALAADFALYYDGHTKRSWAVSGFGGLEREANIIADIPVNYGQVPQYKFARAGERDLETVDAATLSRIFNRCHDELWSGGRFDPTEAFDEMSKILFAKLYDEQRTANGAEYGFQHGEGETDIVVAQRVREQYAKAREDDQGLFATELIAEPRKISNVVRLLQHVSLDHTDPDAKGRAYEQFLGEVFRGRLGQYFTRREIVDFMVSMVAPDQDTVLLDPACGSGGFLVNTMKRVFADIEQAYAGDESAIFRHKNMFATRRLYGIEVNEKIARVAMMDMVINEDGHTNVATGSAFNASFTNPNISDGAFSLVLTNPPFGDTVKREHRDKLGDADLSDFRLSRGKQSSKSEALFIERCTRFLAENGVLGIVVPDGILSNPSEVHVRDYILDNYQVLAVVSLPVFAFRKAGSGMRTSILIGRKKRTGVAVDDYPIFMGLAEHIGYDATGRPDANELPGIHNHYQSGTGDTAAKVIRVRRSALTGKKRLDPLYHILGPVIEEAFQGIPFPDVPLSVLVDGTIQSGKSPAGGAKYSSGEVPLLIVGNIAADGTLRLDDLCFASESFYEANGAQLGVKPLDILIAKDGATTGKVGLAPEDFAFDRCLFNEHIFRISAKAEFPGDSATADITEQKRVNTHYLFFFLKSQLGQQQVLREVSGGAQGGITKGFVENIRIPVPPLEMRREFVAKAQVNYSNYLQSVSQAKERLAHFENSLNLAQLD